MRKKAVMIFALFLIIFSSSSFSTSASTSDGETVVKIAKEYIGVPYKWAGTTPNGFDCSGFLMYIFNKVGISLPHSSSEQFKVGTTVSKSDLEPGDLVFFEETYKSGISHSGIYIGNNEFISATSNGVKITSINDPYYWGPKYVGAKRIIKQEMSSSYGKFKDLTSAHWAYEEIMNLSDKGIISGDSPNTFSPNDMITRAEAAKMIAFAFDLPLSNKQIYNDVTTKHWAYGYINAASNAGFISGYNGMFHPNDDITRGEVATILERAFSLKKGIQTIPFVDVDPSHWAYEAIQLTAANHISTGYPDNTFRPKQSTTRAEFSVFLYNAFPFK